MKKALTVSLVAAAILGGLYAWLAWPHTRALSEGSLTFATVQKATLRDLVSATGLIEPREVIYVGSEMPGTVTRLVVRANDVVTEGAELGQLDDRKILLKVEEAANGVQVAEAALAQARAALTQAKANHEAALLNLKTQ